ncbi:hypothetical protein E4O06_03890 [Treponema sp. OMZ 789]|nr:hypothetical protein E4O06_03890 [Treponema sp. OMZ 789]UTC71168.1 hypothetical protein E4O01_03880 [Treponema sp. OMZ 790]UTC73881.1 hypothetical protein E4O02_04030 [Treponema sp. OMZ 791]
MIFVCGILLHAEIPGGKTSFSIAQSIDIFLNYELTTEAKNLFFEFHAAAKTRDGHPKYAVIPQGFSLKFTPLLYRENKKLYPALSFFYGGIAKSAFLNRLHFKENFEKKPFYKGVSFIPQYLIGITKSKFDASAGMEFAIKNFNLVFFTEQTPKQLRPDISLCAAYKNQSEKITLNISLFSSLKNSDYSQFSLEKPKYDQFYSGEFILEEKENSTSSKFLLAGGLKIPYDKISGTKGVSNSRINFLGKAEYNFQSEYFMFNTGTFFKRDGTLRAFVQPKISVWALDIGFSYNFLRKYLEKKKLYENFNSGGTEIGLSFSNFKFKGELYYEDKTWNIGGQVKIPIKLFFGSLLSIKGKGKLEKKSINPFIVKNYAFSSDIKIKFNKAVNLNLSGTFTQKNKIVKKDKKPYILWEKGIFNFSAQAEFIKKTRQTLNSFKGEIILETAKPFLKAKLAYTIRF